MSQGAPMPHAEAYATALRLVHELAPGCERIAIAGSLRRRKPQVRDIEIVAVARWEDRPIGLGLEFETYDLLESILAELMAVGTLRARPVENHRADGSIDIQTKLGPAFKALETGTGTPVDLFIVPPPRCGECGTILRDASQTHGASLPPVRDDVPRTRDASVLQRDLPIAGGLGQPGARAGDTEGHVPGLPQGVPGTGLPAEGVLQRPVRGEGAPAGSTEAREMDVVRARADVATGSDDVRGLRPRVPAGASRGDGQGPDPRASTRDGAAPGQVPRALREGPPPGWGEGPQSDREPADRDPRAAERDGPLSPLPPGVPRPLACPACGSTRLKSQPSWGVIFGLRTGPGDWNTRLVDECKAIGRRVAGGQVEAWNGAIGRWEVVPTPEEEDFFRAIGQEWVEPPERHVSRVRIRREAIA